MDVERQYQYSIQNKCLGAPHKINNAGTGIGGTGTMMWLPEGLVQ